jgi:hypothetical protein
VNFTSHLSRQPRFYPEHQIDIWSCPRGQKNACLPKCFFRHTIISKSAEGFCERFIIRTMLPASNYNAIKSRAEKTTLSCHFVVAVVAEHAGDGRAAAAGCGIGDFEAVAAADRAAFSTTAVKTDLEISAADITCRRGNSFLHIYSDFHPHLRKMRVIVLRDILYGFA